MRRLVDTVAAVEHPVRRQNIDGELLPAEDVPTRALAPVTRPVISIRVPQANQVDDAGPVYERRTARGSLALESDVFVPGLQAVFTALVFAVMAGLLAWALGWSWRVPVAVLGLSLGLAWLWRLRLVDALLWQVETLTGRDMTGDGRIGKPTRAYTTVNAHDARAQAQRSQRDTEAETQRAALVAFVHRCSTAGTSEIAHGIKASGPDRDAYVRARDVLLALGIAQWRNPERPRAGWQMAVSESEALALLKVHLL